MYGWICVVVAAQKRCGVLPGFAVCILYKTTVLNSAMKPAAPPVLRATRLLDRVRERIRYKYYSLRTEQAYVQWVRMFVKWHGLRHLHGARTAGPCRCEHRHDLHPCA